MSEELKAAQARIACLEGEIAKRDARIVELESGQSADMFLTLTGEITQLRAELAAIKARGVVMPERKTKADYGVYIDEFADEAAAIYNAALDEVARLNAAPASVQPNPCADCNGLGFGAFGCCGECDGNGHKRAAPVQQVSVPASAFASRAITHYEAALLAAFPSGSSGEVFNQWNEARRVLAAAAPAAPAADAGVISND